MHTIIDSFKHSMDQTVEIMSLFDYLERNHFDAIDYSDLLRWVWVQSLSILDKLVHDLVLLKAVDIFTNNKPKTEAFKSFNITFEQCENLLSMDSVERENAVRNIISNRNSCETFQDPAKISKALSYIWEEKGKFYQISQKMKLDESYVKIKLKNIVARRNQIAHQNDMIANNFDKEDIYKTDVLDMVDFIKKLGIAIYDSV